MPESIPTSDPDLRDPNGRIWHPTRQQRGDHTLYVIDGVDGATCPSIALSTRPELENLFHAVMRPANEPGRAAARNANAAIEPFGGAVYITDGGRRFHADTRCPALNFGRFTQAVWAGEDWMDGLYPLVRLSAMAAAVSGYTACRVCVPPHLALPNTLQSFGHEPWGPYDGVMICRRCWTVRRGEYLTAHGDSIRVVSRELVPWPCTSAVVLGLVPRSA
jgi:hypothetical protein